MKKDHQNSPKVHYYKNLEQQYAGSPEADYYRTLAAYYANMQPENVPVTETNQSELSETDQQETEFGENGEEQETVKEDETPSSDNNTKPLGEKYYPGLKNLPSQQNQQQYQTSSEATSVPAPFKSDETPSTSNSTEKEAKPLDDKYYPGLKNLPAKQDDKQFQDINEKSTTSQSEATKVLSAADYPGLSSQKVQSDLKEPSKSDILPSTERKPDNRNSAMVDYYKNLGQQYSGSSEADYYNKLATYYASIPYYAGTSSTGTNQVEETENEQQQNEQDFVDSNNPGLQAVKEDETPSSKNN